MTRGPGEGAVLRCRLTCKCNSAACQAGSRRRKEPPEPLTLSRAHPEPLLRCSTSCRSCLAACSLAHGAPVVARPQGGLAGGTVTYRYLALNTWVLPGCCFPVSCLGCTGRSSAQMHMASWRLGGSPPSLGFLCPSSCPAQHRPRLGGSVGCAIRVHLFGGSCRPLQRWAGGRAGRERSRSLQRVRAAFCSCLLPLLRLSPLPSLLPLRFAAQHAGSVFVTAAVCFSCRYCCCHCATPISTLLQPGGLSPAPPCHRSQAHRPAGRRERHGAPAVHHFR